MGNFYMESTQINYRRDEKLKTVDQKLQELSETSAIDTDIAPVFKSTNTYQPGDMVYYRNKLYVFNVEHTGAWAAADVTATDVTTEISSLKSGLTNVDIALDVPEGSGKNLIPMSLTEIKKNNTSGVWSGDNYNISGVTFTVVTDTNGNVTAINATSGTASESIVFYVYYADGFNVKSGRYTLSGCPAGGSENTYKINWFLPNWSYNATDIGNSETVTANDMTNTKVRIVIANDFVIPSGGLSFTPMLRYASVSDPTFAPYIPSVESRIEAVEVVKHRRVAESATSGTYADKLNSLYTAYTALSDLEKQHSYIVFSANIVPLMDAHNIIFASALKYTSGSTAFNGYSAKLAETGSTMHKIVAGSTGNTISELSSTSNSDIFYLYV